MRSRRHRITNSQKSMTAEVSPPPLSSAIAPGREEEEEARVRTEEMGAALRRGKGSRWRSGGTMAATVEEVTPCACARYGRRGRRSGPKEWAWAAPFPISGKEKERNKRDR